MNFILGESTTVKSLAEAGAILAFSWASSWDQRNVQSALAGRNQPHVQLSGSSQRRQSQKNLPTTISTSATIEDFRSDSEKGSIALSFFREIEMICPFLVPSFTQHSV